MPKKPLNPIPGNAQGTLRAFAVVVLYGMTAEESPAYRSLIAARAIAGVRQANVSIVLWDNSPSRPSSVDLPEDVVYIHDPRNLGLAFAYNQALELAVRRGSRWLITLDQDTTLPGDYLLAMASAANLRESQPASTIPLCCAASIERAWSAAQRPNLLPQQMR